MAIISSEQLKNCQRLLFISPFALGDFLYLKTFLIALKATYPHIEIDIWLDDNRCNQDSWRISRSKILQQWIAAESSFNDSYGCTDSVVARDQQILTAKQQQYDIVICHSPAGRASQFSKIARCIAPKGFIVSSITSPLYNGLLNWWLLKGSDKVYTLDPQSLPKNHHITDRFHAVIHDICGISINKNNFTPELNIPSSVAPITQKWLRSQFSEPYTQGKLIFLNHLSTNIKKDWHLEQLFELIQKIATTDNSQRFIINVTKENYDEVLAATDSFKTKTQLAVAVFTVQNHFFELPSLIASSDFVITVDTAILHFAYAANRPLLAMMRTKKPYWSPPQSKTAHVMYATMGKGYVADISVDSIYKQYLEMNN
ncbi:glycosyltransferase family 9 protein [Shewanella sp. 10N.286.45.A1]|uniref:glycosyltransferase family 9 protein n=1 Tax=Shewanella sp. 10N.286.45.A1 TaxID=3229694 RepID=UPI0035533C9A